jgi:hypothetical protein
MKQEVVVVTGADPHRPDNLFAPVDDEQDHGMHGSFDARAHARSSGRRCTAGSASPPSARVSRWAARPGFASEADG